MWGCGYATFELCVFLSLCIVSMGESESRSNGRVANAVHPHHVWNYEHVTFGLCVFLSLCIVSMRESEFWSNGKVTKDFHPHHTWIYEHVFLNFILRSQIKLGHL